jgi:hypothetical protein
VFVSAVDEGSLAGAGRRLRFCSPAKASAILSAPVASMLG